MSEPRGEGLQPSCSGAGIVGDIEWAVDEQLMNILEFSSFLSPEDNFLNASEQITFIFLASVLHLTLAILSSLSFLS